MVQDPATAKYDSMPRNAIDSVLADIVAPANLLPVKIDSISPAYSGCQVRFGYRNQRPEFSRKNYNPAANPYRQ